MALVELQDGPSQWLEIENAANILWSSSETPGANELREALQNVYQNSHVRVVDLHTHDRRRGVVITNHDKITIAFLGSGNDELIKNMWINAMPPGAWWPTPVYENGNRVHSFFRDLWYGMRPVTNNAVRDAIQDMVTRGVVPKQIAVTGFSMGGGVSILAFTDILEWIRHEYGSEHTHMQPWAEDHNLGSLIQHLTFAAVAAGDRGYYTVLNQLYERHRIRAWDFVNHMDWTVHAHYLQFRAWRGHRYILPDAVVAPFRNEFGDQGHNMLGYLKVAKWMSEHGTDQVKSTYHY